VQFWILDARTAEGLSTWVALWRAWRGRDIMAHPEYALLFARPCDRVVCAVGEDGGGTILFPLIVRPLAAEPWARPGERRWDAVTPYGYGGPFAFGPGVRDHAAFWRAHAEWCRDERIVTTFARLSLFAEQLAPMLVPVEVRSQNIVIPLEGGVDALWRGYESKVRRWVRTAERAGLVVDVDRDGARLDAFLAVYAHTMHRRHADAWYFFPRSFFESIVERLRGHYAFFHTLRGNQVVSSDLVLVSDEHACYFLGGTLAEAFAFGPNYLLKHHVAAWSIAQGKRFCVLGGGYEPGDGVFRYKRAFARRGAVPFRVACLVHDDEACRGLAADRAASAAAEGNRWLARTGFFPPYRAWRRVTERPDLAEGALATG
jgi:Acetyltransferase (GNAT) domain